MLLLLSVQHQQDPGRHCLLDGEDSLPGVLDSGNVAGGPVHGVSHRLDTTVGETHLVLTLGKTSRPGVVSLKQRSGDNISLQTWTPGRRTAILRCCRQPRTRSCTRPGRCSRGQRRRPPGLQQLHDDGPPGWVRPPWWGRRDDTQGPGEPLLQGSSEPRLARQPCAGQLLHDQDHDRAGLLL